MLLGSCCADQSDATEWIILKTGVLALLLGLIDEVDKEPQEKTS
jgi:hypothetical protein